MACLVSTVEEWTNPGSEKYEWFWKEDPANVSRYDETQILKLSFDRCFVKYPSSISATLEENFAAQNGTGNFM